MKRKNKPNKKGATLLIRLSAEEKAEWQKQAGQRGVRLSEHIRQKCQTICAPTPHTQVLDGLVQLCEIVSNVDTMLGEHPTTSTIWALSGERQKLQALLMAFYFHKRNDLSKPNLS